MTSATQAPPVPQAAVIQTIVDVLLARGAQPRVTVEGSAFCGSRLIDLAPSDTPLPVVSLVSGSILGLVADVRPTPGFVPDGTYTAHGEFTISAGGKTVTVHEGDRVTITSEPGKPTTIRVGGTTIAAEFGSGITTTGSGTLAGEPTRSTATGRGGEPTVFGVSGGTTFAGGATPVSPAPGFIHDGSYTAHGEFTISAGGKTVTVHEGDRVTIATDSRGNTTIRVGSTTLTAEFGTGITTTGSGTLAGEPTRPTATGRGGEPTVFGVGAGTTYAGGATPITPASGFVPDGSYTAHGEFTISAGGKTVTVHEGDRVTIASEPGKPTTIRVGGTTLSAEFGTGITTTGSGTLAGEPIRPSGARGEPTVFGVGGGTSYAGGAAPLTPAPGFVPDGTYTAHGEFTISAGGRTVTVHEGERVTIGTDSRGNTTIRVGDARLTAEFGTAVTTTGSGTLAGEPIRPSGARGEPTVFGVSSGTTYAGGATEIAPAPGLPGGTFTYNGPAGTIHAGGQTVTVRDGAQVTISPQPDGDTRIQVSGHGPVKAEFGTTITVDLGGTLSGETTPPSGGRGQPAVVAVSPGTFYSGDTVSVVASPTTVAGTTPTYTHTFSFNVARIGNDGALDLGAGEAAGVEPVASLEQVGYVAGDSRLADFVDARIAAERAGLARAQIEALGLSLSSGWDFGVQAATWIAWGATVEEISAHVARVAAARGHKLTPEQARQTAELGMMLSDILFRKVKEGGSDPAAVATAPRGFVLVGRGAGQATSVLPLSLDASGAFALGGRTSAPEVFDPEILADYQPALMGMEYIRTAAGSTSGQRLAPVFSVEIAGDLDVRKVQFGHVVFTPGGPAFGNITFEGVEAQNTVSRIRDWVTRANAEPPTKPITVTINGQDGNAVRTFRLVDCLPVGYSLPDFGSTSAGPVAKWELEMRVRRVEMARISAPKPELPGPSLPQALAQGQARVEVGRQLAFADAGTWQTASAPQSGSISELALTGPVTRTREDMIRWYMDTIQGTQPLRDLRVTVPQAGGGTRTYDFTDCMLTSYSLTPLDAESDQECEETVTIQVGYSEYLP